MVSEAPPKLAIDSPPIPGIRSVDKFDQLGTSTPPHHSASVPFRWEEQPGRPRPCKTLSLPSQLRGLDPPPGLIYVSKFTPAAPATAATTVLRSLSREADSGSPERGLLGSLVLAECSKGRGSFVIPASRKRAVLGLTKARSNFWATVYGAIKQALTSSNKTKHRK